MNFSERLQVLRRSKKITQESLAETMEYSSRTVQAWENGGVMPPVKAIVKLADFFDTSVDYLLCRTDYPVFVKRNETGEAIEEKSVRHASEGTEMVSDLTAEEVTRIRALLAEQEKNREKYSAG